MKSVAVASNPFALMMNPDSVIQAMEHSDALRNLKLRRVLPLDVLPAPKKMVDVASLERDMGEANFPLWRDLVSSTDPDFLPQLFS